MDRSGLTMWSILRGFMIKSDLIHGAPDRVRAAIDLGTAIFLAKDAMIMFFSSLVVQAMRKSKVLMSLRLGRLTCLASPTTVSTSY